jgi:hypothetical protein
MKKIQKILRHQSQRTTEIYLHSLEADLRDTMKLLEAKNGEFETENLEKSTPGSHTKRNGEPAIELTP